MVFGILLVLIFIGVLLCSIVVWVSVVCSCLFFCLVFGLFLVVRLVVCRCVN